MPTNFDLKNPIFLPKKVLSEKMGFFKIKISQNSVFLGLEIKFLKLLSKQMRFFRSKSVRIKFFSKKNKKNFKKKTKLP